MFVDRLCWLRSGCDTRFGQGWILTAEGVEPADFLYASIQSEAISLWAVLRSYCPVHTSLWSFLSSASFTYEFQGDVLVDWGQRLRIELDPPSDSGIR